MTFFRRSLGRQFALAGASLLGACAGFRYAPTAVLVAARVVTPSPRMLTP